MLSGVWQTAWPMSVSPTALDIAACGNMSADTRRRWVEVHGLLSSGPFTEHDAIETAVAGLLIARTTTQRAPQAFAAVRSQLRIEVLAGPLDLWAVVPQRFEPVLVSGRSQATAAAAAAGTLVWVVALSDAIACARQRYAGCIAPTSADVRSLTAVHSS